MTCVINKIISVSIIGLSEPIQLKLNFLINNNNKIVHLFYMAAPVAERLRALFLNYYHLTAVSGVGLSPVNASVNESSSFKSKVSELD